MRKGYWLREIERLDPVADHLRIYQISAGYEFPWDYLRSLELALFRTYAVPSISTLLAATGEFRERPQKRYDDTALLMAELAAHGYDSPRGREALRVINRAHGQYRIANEDMLYVLSTFVYEPIAWIDRYGWRRLSEVERLAGYHFYREVGARMGISDIPQTYDAFARFKAEYEERQFRYAPTNREIGTYTLELMCGWYPAPLRPAVRLAVRGLLDRSLIDAFGFTPAPGWLAATGRAGLRLRSAVVAVLPRRRTSTLARQPKNRTYPGYPGNLRPSDLGVTPHP
jgi:ER-bound oxygenase mpaB/B'/Rubber oxygenase, catalytic domain